MAASINYADKVKQLFEKQLKEWPFLDSNYKDLNKIRLKRIEIYNFFINIQFNPARIKSSAAKVDKQSIENRACFLCFRPIEQKSVEFEDNFLILINPYPIFSKHLTIIHKEHVPQLIKENFKWMLKLSKALPEFTIFYNGPQSGASAPDHFHFQAGNKGAMPIESQIEVLKAQYSIAQTGSTCKVWKIDDHIRRFILIESDNIIEIEAKFNEIYDKLAMLKSYTNEPDMNILCIYNITGWQVLIFPRGMHRPWQFNAQGDENYIFSPASVDLGGLIILPLEKDFEKIDKHSVMDMMNQIGLSQEIFGQLHL